MILIVRLLVGILVLGIIFFLTRKTISQAKIKKTKAISFRSFLSTIFATFIVIIGFVLAAEIITRI